MTLWFFEGPSLTFNRLALTYIVSPLDAAGDGLLEATVLLGVFDEVTFVSVSNALPERIVHSGSRCAQFGF